VHKNKLNRTSFSKIPSLVEMPDFLSLQKDSFERFLQLGAVEDEREYMGLEGVFSRNVFSR
jgi:DNA-directed RNA polymerase, beta subunit/140 kD subunit